MNEDQKKLIGNRIRMSRVKVGLTQERLAERLDMGRTNVVNYEAGKIIPPSTVLLSMSSIFNVSVDYLLGKTNNPSPENDDSEFSEEAKSIARDYQNMAPADRTLLHSIVKRMSEKGKENE